MKKLMSKVMVLVMALLVLIPVLAFSTPTIALTEDNLWGTAADRGNFTRVTGLGNADLRTTIAKTIQLIISFLGIIAVVIILIGGFKWMTAGGNEEKVGEAKKLIIAGVIGLVIILTSFAIATFVLNSLVDVTNNT